MFVYYAITNARDLDYAKSVQVSVIQALETIIQYVSNKSGISRRSKIKGYSLEANSPVPGRCADHM